MQNTRHKSLGRFVSHTWNLKCLPHQARFLTNLPRPRYHARYSAQILICIHDDVIKWIDFLRYWPFLRGIHRSPVNSSHNGQRRGALMFSLICTWINGWVNNREADDLRRLRTHYDVNVMNISVPTISRVHYCCVLSRIKPVLAIKIVAASLQRESKFKEKRAKKIEK